MNHDLLGSLRATLRFQMWLSLENFADQILTFFSENFANKAVNGKIDTRVDNQHELLKIL